MDRWSALEICYGMSPLALHGDPALADDPELWRDVWDECRDEALAEWIRAAPCSRPTAFYMFEAPGRPRREPGESKPAWLWRVGEISREELETARRHTAETAARNALLSPRDPIAPTEVDELVRDRGLLTEAEIDAMWSSPRRPAE